MSKLIGKRYQLLEKLGTGGMADVYLAYDSVLKRDVALKILRGDLSQDPVALLRFQREASATSGLNHPNIVEVYDVGEDEGQHYIVMEHIKGPTLKELLHRRGALGFDEAVSIMEQLSFAVKAAHEKQIIHRDLKPQNVLVRADGTVKVTDFGIALAGDALQLTRSDSVLGSVHYLAPECSRGESATEQSDIYALGIIFYELLTGQIPYKGENAVDIAMKHMREPFPNIHDINPMVPNSIVNIISKATQKNKANRYLSVSDFARDLKLCLLPEYRNEPLWEPNLEEDEGTKVIAKLNTVSGSKEPNRKKRNRLIMMGLGLFLLLLIPIIYYSLPEPPEFALVPDVIDKPLEEAVTLLEEAGFVVNTRNLVREFHDEIEKNHIILSDPAANESIEKGSEVILTVSSGQTLMIEDYTNWTVDEVKEKLAGFNVNILTRYEVDTNIRVGRIIRQTGLEPNTVIEPDRSYSLVLFVSDYPTITIPNRLIGMDIDEAAAFLTSQDIRSTYSALSMQDMTKEEVERLTFGVVIRTDPTVGSVFKQTEDNSVTLFFYDINDRPSFPEPNNNSNETEEN